MNEAHLHGYIPVSQSGEDPPTPPIVFMPRQPAHPLPRLLTLLVVAFALSAALPGQSDGVTLIPKGASWRFLDDGSNPGTTWKQLAYGDDDWGFGHAVLGYGNASKGRPERTLLNLGPDPFNRHITYYFRRLFYVTDPAALTNLSVRLLRDDGAAVYLNGTEAFRSGLPAGPLDSRTLASPPGAQGADELKYFVGTLPPAALVPGYNLLAVEVHQDDHESPDLAFDLELLANADPTAESATLLRGPYLQRVTTNSIIVRWRTLEGTTSRVRFGPAANDLRFSVQDTDPVTEHEMHLTGLSPDTEYYYSVGVMAEGVAGGPDYFFRTAPMHTRPMRVWAIGDCGTGTAAARAVFDRYLELSRDRYTDVWLMLGDNAYGVGTDQEYQVGVFNQYPELLRQTAVWSTMGNHETYSVEPNGQHAYYNIFNHPTAGQAGGEPSGTEHYYSFNYANTHFVCLDSEESGRQPGNPMLTWLEEDLAGNTREWLIVFWHSPPYTKGSHDSDNPFDNFGNMTDMRSQIVPILESYGADLVLCGHSHNYERSYLMNGHYGFSGSLTPEMVLDSGTGSPLDSGAYLKPHGPVPNQGTVYIVAGSAGFATFQTGRHPIMQRALLRMGSLVLDIDGPRLDGRFLRETGAIDDAFTLLKGAPAEPVRLLKVQFTNGNVTVRWKSRRGHTYTVQKATRLRPADWIDISSESTATSATSTWTDIAFPGAEACFYRVVEVR